MVRGMNATHTTKVDRRRLLRLAADADVDPRTVERALRGEPVRGRAGERVARALEKAGLARREEHAA